MRPAIWPYKINHSSACGRCDLSNKSCLVSYQLTYEPTEFPLSIPVFVSSKHSRILHSSFHQSFSSSWNETWALSVKTQRTGRFVFMWGGGGGDRIRRRHSIQQCVPLCLSIDHFSLVEDERRDLYHVTLLGSYKSSFWWGGGGQKIIWSSGRGWFFFFFFLINFIFKFLLLFARTMF